MDVFHLRDQIIKDYRQYASSFIHIRNDRIREKVSNEAQRGAFYPDPLIQLNPNFKSGAYVSDLVRDGVLDTECRNIFRVGKDGSNPQPMRLYQHQLDAVHAARQGNNYVLTTGTGSGKSLAYIVPIVDHILRQGTGQGIQALIIYPMNALANSQEGELRKFLQQGFDTPPVTFAKYTGQESDERRKQIIANPPDILLTNYVMLELLLTRVHEQQLMDHAQGLSFLVLDELHTYRGRQGADVAMLVRRVRNRLNPDGTLQVVGTSATLASEGTLEDQARENARVASQIFGVSVSPENIIAETLQRATDEPELTNKAYVDELTEIVAALPDISPPKSYDEFVANPFSRWMESAFGISQDNHTGRLVRREPRAISDAAAELADITDLDSTHCADAIERWLLAGYEAAPHSETGKPPFAFRLHQFVSPGDAVYASIQPENERYITIRGQRYVPGSKQKNILYPLVFCRECGQEYYSVRMVHQPEGKAVAKVEPRDFRDTQDEDGSEVGYFYVDTAKPFPHEPEALFKRLPDDWLEDTKSGGKRIKSSRRDYKPRHYRVLPSGEPEVRGTEGVFLPKKFLFCPCCGVTYGARQGEFGKLATLNNEGRSSATTIISISTILSLRGAGEDDPHALPERARKLLSFTDNRQDASLQAGHFNDLIDIGLLRGGLYRAVREAGEKGITHEELAERVFDALNLPYDAYAQEPEKTVPPIVERNNNVLRDVLGYRLYLDLRRGWRITSPNLEQIGLLSIEYSWLDQIAASEDYWENTHDALKTASPATRQEIMKVLLDYMRRELAIFVEYLDQRKQKRIQSQSYQYLNWEKRWAIDENERMKHAAILYPRPSRDEDYGGSVYLSSYGGFGQYLRRTTTFPTYPSDLKMDDTDKMIPELLNILLEWDLLHMADKPRNAEGTPGYQLKAGTMIWKAGDGESGLHDPIRTPQASSEGHVNEFFQRFYGEMANMLVDLQAREHTAQASYDDREERERDFRTGELPVMYCSPTMELGVDIAELNVVHMRNVPPTPANYAQRSGRAGRSGQPALVITYCSSGSPHDQYFFRRPERMVSGEVAPPRIDLANEELVRAHIHAIWLEEAGIDLRTSVSEILDLSDDALPLLDDIYQQVNDPRPRDRTYRRASAIIEAQYEVLEKTSWYRPDWLSSVINAIPTTFDATCDRWRSLYRSARQQYEVQGEIAVDHSRSARDKKQAKMLRDNAQNQINMLTDAAGFSTSDFYSYRYFATEGFLPGYSFPRLPVYAYIPGHRNNDDYLARPRFLAISEFGPRALIYHEGSRYIINQVTLPVMDEGSDGTLTDAIKQCSRCGYVHAITEDSPERCERCDARLPTELNDLLRMETVRTKRRDRISSDEEERVRMGYELRTGIHFAVDDNHQPLKLVASINEGDRMLGQLEYGQAATLWRINLGWRRRKNKEVLGFVLDMERGYWERSENDTTEDDDDPLSPRTARVIPYVKDESNVLLFELNDVMAPSEALSLQTALKQGIEALYQLEDNELAAEVLPEADNPQMLLFYEATEGGAGVLRRLVENSQALAEVAVAALQICHYDPAKSFEDGDLGFPLGSDERCEAACYDCLLSYRNQYVHELLNRHEAADYLYQLRDTVVSVGAGNRTRSEHLQRLRNLCESDLEREWLDYLEQHQLRLPDDAQVYMDICQTRVDFVYRGDYQAGIYIDGPHHDSDEQGARDAEITTCLEDAGATVIRFSYHRDTWPDLIDQYAYIFGGDE